MKSYSETLVRPPNILILVIPRAALHVIYMIRDKRSFAQLHGS